ncbi:MAG TPA: arginine deiminase family protein [Bacteroidales bacterium]
MFRNAIVCSPSPAIIDGITSSHLGKPVYSLAIEEHTKYVETLEQLGLKVQILPGKDLLPDSTFIEDVALCTPLCAIITSPGAASRRNEIIGMREVLTEYYRYVEKITLPATLEAGDVMMVDSHYYVGISHRTNSEGADQLVNILKKFGLTGSKVHLKKMLHLKSGASYLENNNMLVCGEFIETKEFERYNRIIVDDTESYAANSLWINGKVLVPDGFPKTRRKIEKAGYDTIVLNVNEFRKVDGGLSCLSLRF